MIKFFDYTKSYNSIKNNIQNDIEKIIEKGGFINGREVKIFENKISDFLGCKHFTGVSSGTDALTVAIMATVKKKKGNFIVPSFTFTATAMSPLRLGYDIKFVDVEKNMFKPDITTIINACDNETVGVIWPYLFGEPTDLTLLYEYCKSKDIVLIEDCAQSLGTKIKEKLTGNISHVGCFSFFPTKNLGAFGDAGGVSTNCELTQKNIRRIKSHGYYNEKYNSEILGGNFRIDTIQAAVLNRIMVNFDLLLKLRKDNAFFYEENINNEKIIKPSILSGHTWNQYCLIVDDNKRFKKFLENNKIQTNIYYPFPLHKNQVFGKDLTLINTEQLCSKIIAIPIYPGIEKCNLEKIVEVINSYE